MNIFIIGISKTGKTTLAKKYQKKGYQHIKASKYFRDAFPKKEEDFKNQNDFIKEITDFSKKILKKNPFINIDYLKNEIKKSDKNVIEGIRNPFDFFQVFNPKEDIVILLTRDNHNIEKTSFEEGIDIIEKTLKWQIKNKLFEQNSLKYIKQFF